MGGSRAVERRGRELGRLKEKGEWRGKRDFFF
jgi:hypothetical protein